MLDFVENTPYPIDFDENLYEFGFYKDDNVEEYGQVDKVKKKKEGICRKISNIEDKKYICEVQFIKNKGMGFGRYINESGFYYIGKFKNSTFDGYGTKYNSDGTIEN